MVGPGVLEIKCPFNRGQPGGAVPPDVFPWYYMPQVRPSADKCAQPMQFSSS